MNALVYNVNHSSSDTSFFEVSDIYSANNRKIQLGVVLSGNDYRRPYLEKESYSFYHMKGIVEAILNVFNIDERRYSYERSALTELHPGKSANLKIDGKVVASFGELHPETIKKYGLANLNVVVLEMDLLALFNIKTSAKKMEKISRFPSVKRDFAFILKDGISSKEVITEIKKVNRALINRVDVFDVYKGEHIDKEHYSLALSVTFLSQDKTLTENEINAVCENIIKAMKIKFNADLRK